MSNTILIFLSDIAAIASSERGCNLVRSTSIKRPPCYRTGRLIELIDVFVVPQISARSWLNLWGSQFHFGLQVA
ncbi:MAG: hypothetical protein H7126_07385 [Candidatus Parcubacteria bacterium]|uniref:hypothetical protein n=1 Tax=Phormidesmis priestleyi TaxID=268141 RepID=UPI00083AB5B2|nr:hypothetical protein [Phormidesmis priestleyi]MBC7823689.1 hypothetical protein [Leptolyngbyaceae cyanobacterium LF-bin-113]